MALPAKLKNMNIFNDANNYLGKAAEVTLPKLTIKMEGWRGAGMIGEVKTDMGLDALDLEWKVGGLDLISLRQFGIADVAGVLLRFMGAYQADDGSANHAVEIVMRGRHEELDWGSQKPGDDTEHGIKTPLVYYKLIVDGRTEIEIDLLNSIFIVDGVDRYASIRDALGL